MEKHFALLTEALELIEARLNGETVDGEALAERARQLGVPVNREVVTVKEFIENATVSDAYTIVTLYDYEARLFDKSPVGHIKYENGVLTWSDPDGDPRVEVSLTDEMYHLKDLSDSHYSYTIWK